MKDVEAGQCPECDRPLYLIVFDANGSYLGRFHMYHRGEGCRLYAAERVPQQNEAH
jgi:hypothetical protein